MHTPQSLHPIAIFDSGVGGLTVANAIRTVLPHESILYLADTASSPFGKKSSQDLETIITRNMELLLTYPIKMIVIACHTACSCGLSTFKRLLIPVMTIFPSAINPLLDVTPLSSLLVLGTDRTIQSKIYQHLIKTYFPHISARFIGCSPLERLIEEECQDPELIYASLQQLLHSVQGQSFDAAFLACTHFPLYRSFIQKALGPSCTLIDPAYYFSQKIQETLKLNNLLNPKTSPPQDHYLITGNVEMFKRKLTRYFGNTLAKTATCFNQPASVLNVL
jgi:glutamate racemase